MSLCIKPLTYTTSTFTIPGKSVLITFSPFLKTESLEDKCLGGLSKVADK